MKIGIIGLGIVGSAIKYGFQKLGHEIHPHDIKLNTSISDVLNTEICYVCVPTPSRPDGSCDVSIVEQVVIQLKQLGYNGIIAIKSTVSPGTTERLQQQYPDMIICFVPEFLRERCAEVDFTEKHDLCIIGTESSEVFNKVMQSHGKYPKVIRQLTPTEAEFAKYFNNVLNATLITFANSFYEVCNFMKVDYNKIKDAMINIDHIPDKYLDCNASFRGFGGMCLPKDTKAINYLCESNKLPVDFFNMLIQENNKYKITVFEGMRK